MLYQGKTSPGGYIAGNVIWNVLVWLALVMMLELFVEWPCLRWCHLTEKRPFVAELAKETSVNSVTDKNSSNGTEINAEVDVTIPSGTPDIEGSSSSSD